MKKLSGVLFALFLVVGIAHGAAAQEWGRMQGPRASAPTQVPAVVPVAPIIDDPLGDHITSPGNPIVDIDMVEGGTDGTDVTLKITFSPDTMMSEVVGFIDLDTDQNPATGIPASANLFIPGTMQDIGVDFLLSLFNLPFGGPVEVLNTITGAFVGSVPAIIVGQTLEITIPLAILRGDDGAMDVGMVLGNLPQPTDAAPNVGHGTILGGPVPVGGTVAGMSPIRVICRNVTTGQIVTIALSGATSWDCEAAGLIVNTGDTIVQRVRGTAN